MVDSHDVSRQFLWQIFREENNAQRPHLSCCGVEFVPQYPNSHQSGRSVPGCFERSGMDWPLVTYTDTLNVVGR